MYTQSVDDDRAALFTVYIEQMVVTVLLEMFTPEKMPEEYRTEAVTVSVLTVCLSLSPSFSLPSHILTLFCVVLPHYFFYFSSISNFWTIFLLE